MMRRFAACLILAFAALASVSRPVSADVGHDRLAPAQRERLAQSFDAAFGKDGAFSRLGAVVAIVDHGDIVLLRGYGHEDLARQRLIDPAHSRFMIASVTKTFTGVGILQLLQEGRIRSLDDPANAYLKSFRLPKNGAAEVTVRDLLTHQAGFADAALPMVIGDRAVGDAAAVGRAFPGYLRPVRSGSVYSNYGLAVAGAIVADVTGSPLQSALLQGLWAPLGMTQTSWRGRHQMRGPTQTAAFYPDGSITPLPDVIRDHPVIAHGAGGVWSTGADMARFMVALLGDGAASEGVLGARGRELLVTPLGQTAPLTQAYSAAFMLNDWNGERLIEHGGRSLGRISYLTLVPDRKLGIFISVNAEAGAPTPLELAASLAGGARRFRPSADAKTPPGLFAIRAIGLQALFGDLRPPLVAAGSVAGDLGEYLGSWRSERRARTAPTYLLDIAVRGAVVPVTREPEGLSINGRGGYRLIAPDTFWRSAEGERGPGYSNLVVYRRSRDGAVVDMTFGYTDAVYLRQRGVGDPAVFGGLLMFGAVGALSGIGALGWPRVRPWRALAVAGPIVVIVLPLSFFAFWPSGIGEPFNIVLVDEMSFLGFRIASTIAAVWGMAWIAGAFALWRLNAAGIGFRAMQFHALVLAASGVALGVGLVAGQATLLP